VGWASIQLEGSRFGSYPRIPPYSFPRGRPNTVLNGRLPGITARDVLPVVPLGDYSSLDGPTNIISFETFVGAACSTRFAAIQRAERNIAGLLSATQSGSPPVKRSSDPTSS
jgi:hypothetical protein